VAAQPQKDGQRDDDSSNPTPEVEDLLSAGRIDDNVSTKLTETTRTIMAITRALRSLRSRMSSQVGMRVEPSRWILVDEELVETDRGNEERRPDQEQVDVFKEQADLVADGNG
jgi:hypothetical protein